VRARRDTAFENAALTDNWDDAEGYYSEWLSTGISFSQHCFYNVIYLTYVMHAFPLSQYFDMPVLYIPENNTVIDGAHICLLMLEL